MNNLRIRNWLAAALAAMMLTLGWIAGVSAQAEDVIVEESTVEPALEPGVLIVSVLPDSPAAAAGLVRGDIILAVNGEEISGAETLFELVQDATPGDSMDLTILHGDEERDLSVVLGDNEGAAFLGIQPHVQAIEVRAVRGSMSPYSVAMYPMPNVDESIRLYAAPGQELQGVVILEIEADSPAAEAGLAEGDLIIGVDGNAVDGPETLTSRIVEYAPGDNVTLEVHRADALDVTEEISVVLASHPDDETRPYLGIQFASTPHAEFWVSKDAAIMGMIAPYMMGGWPYGMYMPMPYAYPGAFMPMPYMMPFAPYPMPMLGMGSSVQFSPYAAGQPVPGYIMRHDMNQSLPQPSAEVLYYSMPGSGMDAGHVWNFAMPGAVIGSGMTETAAPHIEFLPQDSYQFESEVSVGERDSL